MLVKIASGLEVEASEGCMVVRTESAREAPGEGLLPIVGFEGDLVAIQVRAGEDAVLISGEAILAVVCPVEPPVVVELGDGKTIRAPKSVAPVLIAVIEANRTLVEKMADLMDTTDTGAVKRDLAAARELLQRRTDILTRMAALVKEALE